MTVSLEAAPFAPPLPVRFGTGSVRRRAYHYRRALALPTKPRETERATVNQRSYPAGTREALVMLSRGLCYAPECERRVMRCEEGRWCVIAHVAHICGLKKGSARHDEFLAEPSNFRNLLLCKPHHDLADDKRLERIFACFRDGTGWALAWP